MLSTWQDALDYLYGLANWETRPPGSELTFELDRVLGLLSDLGDPHVAWPAVHVAGTNGKGSTCALVAAGLRASGYRVGLFTSPHLHTVRERVQVNGTMISERAVLNWLNRNRVTLDHCNGLTTFEALTALAFDTFRSASVDVAVIEVGLGGRLDTTNVVRPAVCAFTPIALDHRKVLGDTVSLIAADKVGILKPGVPAVSAPQLPGAAEVIDSRSAALRCPLVRVGSDVACVSWQPTETGQEVVVRVSLKGHEQRLLMSIGLAGAHQRVNALIAVGVLAVLRGAGWDVDLDTAARGMADARWPGRFEWLSVNPMVIVDGAHNEHATTALCTELEDRYRGRRKVLIVGASHDKDVDSMLVPLLETFDVVYTTCSEHPRAMAPAMLANTCEALGVRCRPVSSPGIALEEALADAGPEDVLVATGSIFLAGDVREAWAQMGHMPMPPRDPPPL